MFNFLEKRRLWRCVPAAIAIFGATAGGRAASLTYDSFPLTNSFKTNGSILFQVTESASSPLARIPMDAFSWMLFSNMNRTVFPETYGGAHDGTILTDVTATSGNPTVTSASAAFTSADVGKAVCLYTDTTNRSWVLSTIQTVNSGTSITLADNSTKTWAANGRLIYGTDNANAISNCLNFAYTNKGGTIQFGAGIYVVATGLHTNAQTTFRDVSILTPVAPGLNDAVNSTYELKLVGSVPRGCEYEPISAGSSFAGTVIFCPAKQPADIRHTNSYALLSCNGSTFAYNGLNLTLQNLNFKMPVDPQLSVVSDLVGGGIIVDHCTFDVDFPAGYLAVAQNLWFAPTGQWGTGGSDQAARAIYLPGSFNTARCIVRDTLILGYGTGIQIGGVHAQLYNVGIHDCNEAIMFGATNVGGTSFGGVCGGFRIHPLANRYDVVCPAAVTGVEIDWHSYTPEGYFVSCNPTNLSQWSDPGNNIAGFLSYEPDGGGATPIATFGTKLTVIDDSTGNITLPSATASGTLQAVTVQAKGSSDGNNQLRSYGGDGNSGYKFIGLNNDWLKLQSIFYGVVPFMVTNWTANDWAIQPSGSLSGGVDLGGRVGGTGMQWKGVYATNLYAATLQLAGLGDNANFLELNGGTGYNLAGFRLYGLNNDWFKLKSIFYGVTPLMVTNWGVNDWAIIPDVAAASSTGVDLGRTTAAGPTYRAAYVTNLTTYNANKAALITSNVVVSPYLWTNPFAFNAVVYISGAGGGSNSVAQNGSFIGYMTNGCTLLVQPGEYVWNTNGAAHPNFSIKPF